MTSTEKIHVEAKRLIAERPSGVRYSELLAEIHAALPNVPRNTIVGALHKLKTKLPADLYMPAKGVYKHTKFKEPEEKVLQAIEAVTAQNQNKIQEEAFYKPFADWIVNELEECTKAVVLGGNRFKDKWGTPDIIGKRESRKSDIIQAPTEIVSAEVKIDSSALIVAFGQACAYKLFSHKSYIVIPFNSPEEDIARLDSLSRIFGIGLILFDSTNPGVPNFTIRVRGGNHIPDMFYVSKFMKLIENELFS